MISCNDYKPYDQVWDTNNPRLADYVGISVGLSVYPREEEFNVGDVVCFHSPIVSQEGKQLLLHSPFIVEQMHAIQLNLLLDPI